MQTFYHKKSDPSSIIMRNPYESLSGSQQSSKFGQIANNDIEVKQFIDNKQTSRSNIQTSLQNEREANRQMKYMYSFCDEQSKPTANNLIIFGQNSNKNIKPQKLQNLTSKTNVLPEYHYSQRLTFQNQGTSPFARIQPKNSNQESQLRYSFNPLQNKVNQLQKMCKKLYESSSQQNKKCDVQFQSIARIQQKVDFLIQLFRKQQIRYEKQARMESRTSNQNKKRSSIPLKSNERNIFRQSSMENSSEKLSRYLEPPSSSESKLRKIEERSMYNNSKCISSNNTKRIKPFLLNSDIQNSSYNNCQQNTTLEFNQCEQNKQNLNYSNVYCNQQKNGMKKKNDNNVSNEKKNKDISQFQNNRKSKTKQVKQKSIEIRKSNIKNNQNQHKQPRVRAKSQKTINRKKFPNTKNPQHVQYENSFTAPYAQNQKNSEIYRKQNHQLGQDNDQQLQNSEVFRAVNFPHSNMRTLAESKSTELSGNSQKYHKNRSGHNNTLKSHNMTLLQSIQEKKMLIDRQLSKRLMKNSSILYGDSTNLILVNNRS